MKRLFAILPGHADPATADAALAIVEADDSMGALDAFAVKQGFVPYSIHVQHEAGREDVYVRPGEDGTTLGAIFTNDEITVYPLTIASSYGR